VEFNNLLTSRGINGLFIVICDTMCIALAKFETLFLFADKAYFAYRPEPYKCTLNLSYLSGMGSCIFQVRFYHFGI